MRKIETIWQHILYRALERKQYKHTQKELASLFDYSLSTVHHALGVPAKMGALRKTSKFFVLEDFEKLLYYWGSVRNLEADLLYNTYLAAPVLEIEGLVLPGSIYAGYSAARRLLGEPPSDYAKVYFYISQDRLNEVVQRFPRNSQREANIFALKMPVVMPQYGAVTTLPQTFVDIWNMRDWYSRDFTRSLKEKIDGLLS